MLTFNEMDALKLQVLEEGEMSLEDVDGTRDLINAYIRGEPVFDSVEVVELDDFPVPNSAGLYLTLRGVRIFLMLVGYQPTCRIGAIDLLTHANAVWQAGWFTQATANDLSTRGGAIRMAKTWTSEITAELRDEERQKDVAATALMARAEDLSTWHPIAKNAPIEGYAWRVVEERSEIAA